MNVQIPVKWLQELLALCGPEDHELRERVMVSITAMNEQAAGPVVTPEPDAAIKEVMELVGAAMDSAMKAGELLLDSHEKFNAQFASAKSLKNSIESKLRALLATATGLPAQAVPLKLIEAINTAYGGNEWQGDAQATDLLDPACRAISSLAPRAQEDARLRLVRQVVRDFHYALDNRKHGGVAAGAAMNAIELALNMYWQQGQEADRRANQAAQGGE